MSTRVNSGRAWVDVNLEQLLANARAVLARAPRARLLPMVKANAYGLGAVPCARALERLDPWGFGVATVEEGIELRDAGITRPLLVLTPAVGAQRAAFRRYDLRAVLDRPEVANRWDGPFHLEVDTGMARCGVRWDDASALAACASPQLEGAFTHFFAADTSPESVDAQWQRFTEAVARLGRRPALLHVANSAGVWRLHDQLDLVRPGIYVYGGQHAPDLPPPLPVAAVRAPVVSVRRVAAGDGVSYGADWRAPAPTTIATLGIGYADGLPRAVQGKAAALLHGRRYPVVGRIAMDFIMLDVGAAPPALAIGEAATLIGADGEEAITVDEVAGWAGTIAYEILARLGPRVPRIYTGAA